MRHRSHTDFLPKVLFIFTFCCSQVAFSQSLPDKPAIPNIIAPIRLNRDTTTIHLTESISDPAQIDSLSFSKGLTYQWNKKEGIVFITAQIEVTPLAEMKLWIKGSPYSVILRTSKGASAAVRPMVATSKLGPASFTISIKYQNPGFSIAVYWQNFRLGHDYLKPVGDELLISIPDDAKNMERSYIRIFCSDTFNAGNDILLPLQNGAVIRDPSLLKLSDLQSQITRYVPVNKFEGLGSQLDHTLHFLALTTFIMDDVPFDNLGSALIYNLDTFGSHYVMGHLCMPIDLPDFLSYRNNSTIKTRSRDSTYDRLTMLIAYATAIPGVPLLNYGDTTQPDRKAATDSLTTTQKKLKETVVKLFALRASHMALMYGETQMYARGDIMIIERSYFSERIIFVFNKSRQAQTIETGTEIGGFVPKFGHIGTGTKVTLPPLSFEEFIGRRM